MTAQANFSCAEPEVAVPALKYTKHGVVNQVALRGEILELLAVITPNGEFVRPEPDDSFAILQNSIDSSADESFFVPKGHDFVLYGIVSVCAVSPRARRWAANWPWSQR